MRNSEQQRIAMTQLNFPPGTRIELSHMDDPYAPVPPGTRGTVQVVDDAGQIHMNWDNGRSLAVIPGVDSLRKLSPEEVAQEQVIEIKPEIIITEITPEDLRRMQHQEGLIIQGCGGDLKEWVGGMNRLLTKKGILVEGTKFTKVYTFRHEGKTCLLFPFDKNVKLNLGKLTLWRLTSHEQFGGTWLSDYVDNRLGGFVREEQIKPDCPLVGQNGNIYNLLGIASRTLCQHGLNEQAEAMCQRVIQSGSYEEALNIIGDYVNITSVEQTEEPTMEMQ